MESEQGKVLHSPISEIGPKSVSDARLLGDDSPSARQGSEVPSDGCFSDAVKSCTCQFVADLRGFVSFCQGMSSLWQGSFQISSGLSEAATFNWCSTLVCLNVSGSAFVGGGGGCSVGQISTTLKRLTSGCFPGGSNSAHRFLSNSLGSSLPGQPGSRELVRHGRGQVNKSARAFGCAESITAALCVISEQEGRSHHGLQQLISSPWPCWT